MTSEQAIEIREFLIAELNINGFSNMVTTVNTSLKEIYEEEDFERSQKSFTIFFLREIIEIFKSLSNKNYENIIQRFNQVLGEGLKVNSIFVELLGSREDEPYDLKDLPDYSDVISTFEGILQEIRNDN